MISGTPIPEIQTAPTPKKNNGIKIFSALAVVLGLGITAFVFKPKNKIGDEIEEKPEGKKTPREKADEGKKKITPSEMQKKAVETRRKNKLKKEAEKLAAKKEEENDDTGIST